MCIFLVVTGRILYEVGMRHPIPHGGIGYRTYVVLQGRNVNGDLRKGTWGLGGLGGGVQKAFDCIIRTNLVGV